jgi:glycosyl transferase, family 25
MQVYVINLDRRPDRLAEISQRLDALGLTFTRVPAVDGLTLPDNHSLGREQV